MPQPCSIDLLCTIVGRFSYFHGYFSLILEVALMFQFSEKTMGHKVSEGAELFKELKVLSSSSANSQVLSKEAGIRRFQPPTIPGNLNKQSITYRTITETHKLGDRNNSRKKNTSII